MTLLESIGRTILQCVRFIPLAFIKSLRYYCYPIKITWLNKSGPTPWQDIRFFLILNHTSIIEFIYGGALPFSFLWRMAGRLTFPVAKETLDHPFLGFLFKSLAPYVVPITRKRDDTWNQFTSGINNQSMVAILPEGRMRRQTGLDKNNQPMSTRSGVAEILPHFAGEKLLFVYSGGLHHVLPPGKKIPRPFRKIAVAIEVVDTDDYLNTLGYQSINQETSPEQIKAFAQKVANDLDVRRQKYTPNLV